MLPWQPSQSTGGRDRFWSLQSTHLHASLPHLQTHSTHSSHVQSCTCLHTDLYGLVDMICEYYNNFT